MVPISAYIELCRELSQESYCEQFPHPVLVLETHRGKLEPTKDTSVETIERMIFGRDKRGADDKARGTRASTQVSPVESPGLMYSIFYLAPTKGEKTRTVVGCSSDCDVQINDHSISKQHAIFRFAGETTTVQDNDSSAGTRVNDEIVDSDQPRELATGDRISLGFVDLIFLPAVDLYWVVRRLFID
jgi:hypothetical protein